MLPRRSQRIRLREARDLYSLIGECRALGTDGVGWRRHLVIRLREILNADIAFFADNLVVGSPGSPEGWIKPLSIIDDGWQSEEERQVFWSYVRRGRMEENPMRALLQQDPVIRIARRRDILSDEPWYASHFYRNDVSRIGLDDFVQSLHAGPQGVLQMLFFQRRAGREPFSRRVVHLLKMIWIELRRHQPHELRSVDESALMTLPRRMLQVLACLLIGHTAKETANILGISVHTVQEHVKRLYKRSGTKNRAELADRYRDMSSMLLALPLDELPNHREQIERATRAPWPEEPPHGS